MTITCRQGHPLPAGWFTLLGWTLTILSTAGNLLMLLYVSWIRSLSGAAYAQADAGLFFLLVVVGGPIVIGCLGLLILGWLLRYWSCPWTCPSNTGFTNLLRYSLTGNPVLVGFLWMYLFFLA